MKKNIAVVPSRTSLVLCFFAVVFLLRANPVFLRAIFCSILFPRGPRLFDTRHLNNRISTLIYKKMKYDGQAGEDRVPSALELAHELISSYLGMETMHSPQASRRRMRLVVCSITARNLNAPLLYVSHKSTPVRSQWGLKRNGTSARVCNDYLDCRQQACV